MTFFSKHFEKTELVVASFDHKSRESSSADLWFVKRKAEELGLNFYAGELSDEKSGEKLSEETARKARYDFLRKTAFAERAEIFTAHHLDDLVESVTINFVRGTDFRGLAPLSALGIRRPFIDGFLNNWEDLRKYSAGEIKTKENGLNEANYASCDIIFDKKSILRYAAEHGIVFREDPTNQTDLYLRNRVREQTRELSTEDKLRIYSLFRQQRKRVREIETEIEAILPEDLKFEREMFKEMPDEVASEILREGLKRVEVSTTRPQRQDFLKAIREYGSEKQFNLPGGKLIKLHKKSFGLREDMV